MFDTNKISPLTKGLGKSDNPAWDILAEDVSLPVAVLYQQRIENNLRWMQRFSDTSKVKLAPHGKTTMTPELFKQQINSGAWAMTLATAQQVRVSYEHGIKRVLMANQLIGKQNMQIIADLLVHNDFEFYCVVDSVDNVNQLGRFFKNINLDLNILLEIGVPGGRCGCRTTAQIEAVIEAIDQHDNLLLSGIEFYEGVIHGDNAESQVRKFLAWVINISNDLLTKNKFSSEKVILTGAGSAWYDVVSDAFIEAQLDEAIIPVIRPGCYLIHDTGIYQDAQNEVLKRSQLACDLAGDLQSTLEVWAYVQSIPESGLAVIGMGKRDVAFDDGMPIPELFFRPQGSEKKPTCVDKEWKVTAVMDQHAFLKFPENADIKVGDMIAFSTSHPCLTFDKWRNILMIDHNYKVKHILQTYF
ncbi:MAG: amino acid deaminase [Psychromonas sp.]